MNLIRGKPEINFNLPMGNFPAPTVMSGSLGSSQRPEVPFPVMPGTGPNASSMGIRSSSSSTNTIHEHFKRWQKYNKLVRRFVPSFPDTEALSSFMIPVLRSLSRFRPDMKIQEGVHYTLNKWLKTTKADRKIYYQIAKKFIEEEEAENIQRSNQQMVEADKTYDINMETEGSLEAGVDEETTAKSVKLPKSVEGSPSEDSLETELLHYIETLCDQPEFLSQVKYLLYRSPMAPDLHCVVSYA
ncbi:uncharacterized protein LOC142100651 [Mixophyes fleayi]|uniref:uncharacterized protein LOC142100651 n=1 Tax=Mixophyes fleayi TaxID=3061075 RepID=UPI003F4DCA31